MKRILLAILLDVIATIGLIYLVVLPSVMPIESVPGLSTTLQSLLCEKREILNVERYSYQDSEGTHYSANFYCTYETKTRDVTGQAVLFGILIFSVPLVISIFLFISGGMGISKKRRAAEGLYGSPADVGFGVAPSFDADERSSTTERLRTLKRAYDEGLISESEYEAKRQDILHEL